MGALRLGLVAIGCLVFLTACQEDGLSSTNPTVGPDLFAQARQSCERSGGRWGAAVGKSFFVCYRNMRDAGKSCRVESDCQGLCLARSMTCSPIEPFFGCHEVIGSNGLRQTRCVD